MMFSNFHIFISLSFFSVSQFHSQETKHLRNRTAHLKYIAEYGMEVAIKLSFLSQNWESLLSDMVEKAGAEIFDEAAYKRTKMAEIRTNKTA